MDIAEHLQAHHLADGLLPYAPRYPFRGYSLGALRAAAALAAMLPEKRGILTHVVRHLQHQTSPPLPSGWTIEAHFDAVAVPPVLADRLLELGFEPDGFAVFVPAHFGAHFTLKFKTPSTEIIRRQELRVLVEGFCEKLITEVDAHWPELEAYLEIEAYPASLRRSWPNMALRQGWEMALPFSCGDFETVLPPCNEAESSRTGLALTLRKRADIHLKVAVTASAEERGSLLRRIQQIGFYRVLTWAGNDVCTAQFAESADARACFTGLAGFFDAFGGCSELTLEPVLRVWRSATNAGGVTQFGSLPPLVTSIQAGK